jgi:NAD(P)H-nitrite reductase large subunit
MADRVLSSILDSDSAKVMQNRLEENGLEFLLGDSVKVFNKNTAVMNSGKTVEFDVLVLAVGVRAKTDTAVSAGCKTDRGILTDKKMQTSVKNIYAAGDCAQGYDMLHGENRIIAIMPNAYIQGFTAGKNMTGEKAVFENAVAMNSIGFFGLHAMTAGVYEGDVFDESDEKTVKKLFVKDDRLVGFILIGQTERAGIYTSLIRERIPLSSVDFDALKKVASTFAFSKTERHKKFGGAV